VLDRRHPGGQRYTWPPSCDRRREASPRDHPVRVGRQGPAAHLAPGPPRVPGSRPEVVVRLRLV